MIQQQTIPINFSKGLDTKTDPKQVQIGNFLEFENSVFTTTGRLTKRNGFGKISTLPNASSVYLTTFSGNLTAIGTALQAYVEGNSNWVDKGNIQPISLSVIPVARSAINQVQCDSITSENGIVCTVYTESNGGTLTYSYVISDSTSGQNIVDQTPIPVASGAVTGSARVFILGGYFLIVFTNTISGVHHLQYIAVSISSPTTVIPNADLAASYAPTNALSWDGVVVGNNFYFAYYSTSGGNSVKFNYLESSFAIASAVTFAEVATIMSVTADLSAPSNPVIYASFYDSASSTGYVVAVNTGLQKLMNPTEIIASGTVYNITSVAQNGVITTAYEVSHQYSYDSSLASNFINSVSVTLPATLTTGTVGSTTTVSRSVGLASKAFLMSGTPYLLAEYASSLQSTYFLMDFSGNIISRFAYENGGASLVTSNGYLPYGLPQAQVIGTTVSIAYLYKDLIESQNTTGLVESIGPAGATNIYSQTGVNLVSLDFSSQSLFGSEIGKNLNLTGGMLWAYDGALINEQNFHVFPDNVELTTATTGGSITAQQYYYQVTYEWTDAQGNLFRSAPSVPVTITTTGSTSTITVNVPTLRLSYKTNVKIQIYRWSTANQVYYQVTSITAPTLNNPSADSISYVDILSDSAIIGNNIIYTTGGVVEDIPGPAAIATTLFDTRLWLIDAEDQNLLWFSKQVIESTPVEMSDLFTFYVPPTTGAQGSTGTMTALAPLDSSLIIFKKDAMYYIQGAGPDNTGANNAYTQPIYITSTVGCANQNSIVVMNDGLMFQSDKGIWLLTHALGVEYIGAPVEKYNSSTVTSAAVIPGTTQVRFTLDTGEILMYDYYFQQWGVFTGSAIPAISSTLYQGMHTLLGNSGLVLQETLGAYLDNGNPVLISFLTGNIQLAGISGYQRIYEIQLLGDYLTPHLLQVQFGYDFAGLSEQAVITPTNNTGVFGSDALYGQTTPYGGTGALEQWRIQPATQKCQTFQFALQEIYDPSLGVPAGAGFTLSAMTCTIGVNRRYRPVKAANTIGTG
jgi:hypothetical protein